MAYCVENFKTKKELRAAVAERDVEVYQPGGIFPMKAGRNSIEGPHYPKPHTWYASVEVVYDDVHERFVIPKGSKVQ